MKRIAWLPGLLVLLAAATPPKVPSSLDHFQYRPETIRVGEVAHYVKSNLDGSKPARVSIFVASPENLEVAVRGIHEELQPSVRLVSFLGSYTYLCDELLRTPGAAGCPIVAVGGSR